MIFKTLIHNLFTKKITIAKWQLNLFGVILFGLGAVFGVAVLTNKLIIPGIFALNDTTKTWTFNTANAGNYSYDTSLVTVDDTGAYPVSGVNKLSNPAFASDTSSWTLLPVNGNTTTNGWIAVPGNATYTAADTGFLVMKYDAKCASTSSLGVGLTAPADTTYKVYKENGVAGDQCTSGNNRAVVSLASGYPIAYISQTEAVTRCNSISVGSTAAHLITNAEWMTIARNAEAQATNWSLGAAGSGYLYAGHNDNYPATALQASTNDNNKAAYTDDAGTTEALTSATNTANGQSGTRGNQVRTLTLSNGSVIWDFAGNVWQWTNNTIMGADKPVGVGSTSAWSDWNTISSWGTLTSDLTRPSNSSYYGSGYGVGQYYQNLATGGPYGFLRGAGWGGSSTAGAFALFLGYSPSIRNYSVGFRCASGPVAISQSFSSSSGRSGGGNTIAIGSLFDGELVQSVNVGSTASFDFSAYAYDSTSGNEGGTVNSDIVSLFYDGAGIGTTYTEVGSGWWKLSATITGANASKDFGVLVKSGKTVKVDDFTLSRQGTYSVYTTSAYSNSQVYTWDSFTPTVTASGNASVVYQLCPDDGSTCQTNNSWKYWNGSTWATATDTITTVNTAAQLTQTATQALPVTSKKISVKAIMSFGGSDTPILSSIAMGLTTTPTSLTLDSPSDNSYTNSERPTFRWKGASDSASGLSKYVLEVDNPSAGTGQASGDFSLDSLPTSRTTDYETNKYVIHYENFSDSDSTNDYISAYTKSSTDWSTDSNSGQNDGKLREGKVSWKVRAVNNAGAETSSSRTLLVDRTSPKIELTQINSTPFSSTSFSTTDTTPTIYGKITDPLSGGDSSQTQDENGPKIASGPKQVEIKVEKKEGLGYKLHTLYTINMDKPWYTCDGKEVTDNSKQKCDKYLPFKYAPEQNLDLGTYRITISGKDKADNSAPEKSFTLNITTLTQITTPEEKKIIEKEIKELPKEEQEKVKEELEITKPQEPSALEKTIRGIGHAVQIGFNTIGQGAKFIFNTTGQALAFVGKKIGEGAKAISEGYNKLANNAPVGAAKTVLTAIGGGVSATGSAIASVTKKTINTAKGGIANITFKMGEKVQDVSDTAGIAIIEFGSQLVTEPTRISDVQAIAVSPTSAKVSWTTNHSANGKVNWGFEEGIYEFEDQTDKRTTYHEFILTNLKPNTKYHYEVMSHNKNYVYDANREFKTPSK